MENTPQPHHRHESETSETDAIFQELPDPQEIEPIITMLLADQARENYFSALLRCEDIDAGTARTIAYNLLAHAPATASTAHLEHFYKTGHGTHAALKAEYLPLYKNSLMPAEGRMLLDALGTFLLHQEEPHTRARGGELTTQLEGGLAYSYDGAGERVAIAFQMPAGFSSRDFPNFASRLELLVREEGDRFRAFLRLPGIDATRPDLRSYFRSVELLTEEEARAADRRAQMRPKYGPFPDRETVEVNGRTFHFSR